MSWKLYRWTWHVRAPLYLGLPPAGALYRTRLLVPARTLWGALTAELARHEGGGRTPDYASVGDALGKDARIGYLFPAELSAGSWRVWLPVYREGTGLVWVRGDQPGSWVPDLTFRRRILSARSGTSIDPSNDAAEDGSLRETECIQPRWRTAPGTDGSPLAMMGYVFFRDEAIRERLEPIRRVFVGGDARYGFGLMEREEPVTPTDKFFGDKVVLDTENPLVDAAVIRAHVAAEEPALSLSGAQERIGGWSWDQLEGDLGRLWAPGSRSDSPIRWNVCKDGFWRGA